jgi:hypothetical protein
MKFLGVFTLFVFVSVASGQPNVSYPNVSYYVATTGKDPNPGTQSAPWRTIQHAADTAHAGSTVYVRGGTYEELVRINVSGNANDGFITFRSYPGETAVLDASRFTPQDRQGVLTIRDQSYVRIEELEIRNFRTAEHHLTPLGINVIGSGSHIELLKNNVHHIQQTFEGRDAPGRGGNGFGIAVYGTNAKAPITDLIIDGNEVHHLKTGSSESLVVNGNVTNFRITHNIVHDNNNIGIDVIGFERTAPDPAVDQARDGVVSQNLVYNITSRGNPAYRNDESSDGIYVDGGTRILIERNTIHDVDFGVELASEHKDRATSYITARNNLIYQCHTAGVSIGGYAPDRGRTEHSTLINNTLYENDTSSTGSGEFQMQWNMAKNVFANNIVYAGPRCLISLTKRTSGTITGFNNYVKSTGNDQHSRFLDPRFIDPVAQDFHLQPGSSALGAGIIDKLPVGDVDLDGSPRLSSGKIDLGCYQKP